MTNDFAATPTLPGQFSDIATRVASLERLVRDPFRKTYINVKDFGAKGDGTTDDTGALQAAFAAATTTGVLTGSANRSLYIPGGTYIVNSMLTMPASAVIHGDGPDLTIIKAGSSFTFTDGNTAIMRSPTAQYEVTGSGRRLSIDGLLIHGNSVSGANGLLIAVQQPAYFNNVRVRDCPGYGVYATGQQFVTHNFEVTNAGTCMFLDGVEFGYFHGTNLEQGVDYLLRCRTIPSGITTGQCLFSGLHMEGLTAASGYAVDVTDGFGMTFINPYFANQAGQHFFKFSGSKASYKIVNARNATSSGSSQFVNDAVNSAVGTVLASDLNSDREAVDFTGGVPIMAQSGIRVGTQSLTLTRILAGLKTSWNPAAVNAGRCAQTTITVTGAAVNDRVMVSHNNGGVEWVYFAVVSAADTVTVNALNCTGANAAPGVHDVRVNVYQYV